MMEVEPWQLVSKLYPDLVLLVEGRKLYYHQAVLAQHSALLKDILLRGGCCKCKGEDCRRSNENVFISLGDVKAATVQYVMELVYAGSGRMAGDTAEYRAVIHMLGIDTVVVEDAEANVQQAEDPAELRRGEGRRKQEETRRRKKEKEARKNGRGKENVEDSIQQEEPKDTKTIYATKEEPAKVKEPVDDDIEILSLEPATDPARRFSCPFLDCSSESRTAQSIKVHLALVHYKKRIQAEFPNWRTQKCEQCDRGFGQMTAYYLHMAQHRRYPHMEAEPVGPARPPGPAGRQPRTGSPSLPSRRLSIHGLSALGPRPSL